MGTKLPDRIRDLWSHRRPLPEGGPVLLLVSGGADSTALLHLAAEGVFDDHPLRVLHVDHMLRGEESRGDAAFVSELCARLRIPCSVRPVDVAAIAAGEGSNLEEVGRRERYRLADEELDNLCNNAGADPASGLIMTAHTRDDRVETFYMRSIVGGGPGAFGSIPRTRGRIVRPLLDVDRDDLREYLAERGEGWREDASNQDVTKLRAFVRSKIVPQAKSWNPALSSTLARSMDLIAQESAFLDEMAQHAAGEAIEYASPEVELRFDVEVLGALHPVLARRVLRDALTQTFPRSSRIETFHIEAILEGMSHVGFVTDVPGNLRVRREYAKLTVLPCDVSHGGPGPCELRIPGEVVFGEGRLTASYIDPAEIPRDRDRTAIDADLVGEVLVVDGPREGDRFKPLGMDGTKKLSDLLVDEKVPRRKRASVPVVRDGSRVVWVAGMRMDDGYKVTETTKRAVLLTWSISLGTEYEDDE